MKKTILLFFPMALVLLFSGCSLLNMHFEKSDGCQANNGTWLANYQECEYVSEDWCQQVGGLFDSCTSACRHDPKAQSCTMQCVPVCSFSFELSELEAKTIAENNCIKGGESLDSGVYNENTQTWWFKANLNISKPGCNPACVVSEATKTAEINWLCTGLIEPEAK